MAVVAAVISYQHAYELVRSHGESGVTARLLPFTVDGLIWAASMVVLDASRPGQPVPQLAAWSLGTGIVATVGANLARGVGHGPVGALVSAWPALALEGPAGPLSRRTPPAAACRPRPGTTAEGHSTHKRRARPVRTVGRGCGMYPGIRGRSVYAGHRPAAAYLAAGFWRIRARRSALPRASQRARTPPRAAHRPRRVPAGTRRARPVPAARLETAIRCRCHLASRRAPWALHGRSPPGSSP